MNKTEAIKFFGTQVKLAAALGMTQHAVSAWGEFPPPLRQLQIEKASGGTLMAQTSILGDVVSIGKSIKRARAKNPSGNKHMGLTA